jgi:hypothetical protein
VASFAAIAAAEADRNDDVRLILRDLRRKGRQACEVAFGGAAIDHDGLALDVAQIAHALPERGLPRIGTRREKANVRNRTVGALRRTAE